MASARWRKGGGRGRRKVGAGSVKAGKRAAADEGVIIVVAVGCFNVGESLDGATGVIAD